MAYIKEIIINGFKKFQKETIISFNKGMNILIGDNESGKTTVLEAIDLLINPRNSYDGYQIKEWLNIDNRLMFERSKDIKDLPQFYITIKFDLPVSSPFCEKYYDSTKKEFGLTLTCSIPNEDQSLLKESLKEGRIPYDYYSLTFRTFHGESYKSIYKPVKTIMVDASLSNDYNSTSQYTKRLFHDSYSDDFIIEKKDSFREKLTEFFIEKDIDTKFVVNERKAMLENLLAIQDKGILLDNRGSGESSVIKINYALKKSEKVDVVLLEEPENHLSFLKLRELIENINTSSEDKQIIITTHSNMIVSSLGLDKIIMLSNNAVKRFTDIEETSKFFQKSANSLALDYILSNKVILVEGPTEAMMLPLLYKQYQISNGVDIDNLNTFDKQGIYILPIGGLSFDRYLSLSKDDHKKLVALLSDNDGSKDKIDSFMGFNGSSANVRKFTDGNVSNFTFEVGLYNANKEAMKQYLKDNFTINKTSVYYKGANVTTDYDVELRYWLANKTEVAFNLVIDDSIELSIPDYIKECFNWLKNW